MNWINYELNYNPIEMKNCFIVCNENTIEYNKEFSECFQMIGSEPILWHPFPCYHSLAFKARNFDFSDSLKRIESQKNRTLSSKPKLIN